MVITLIETQSNIRKKYKRYKSVNKIDNSVAGTYKRLDLTIEQMKEQLQDMDNKLFCLGRPEHQEGSIHDNWFYQKNRDKYKNLIARTKEHLADQAEWILLDIDTSDTIAHIQPSLAPTNEDEVTKRVYDIFGADTKHLIKPSSSRMAKGSNNWHVYIPLTSPTSLKSVSKHIEYSLGRLGLLCEGISSSGATLKRNHFCDMAVFSPERLIYEATPLSDAPLKYNLEVIERGKTILNPSTIQEVEQSSIDQFYWNISGKYNDIIQKRTKNYHQAIVERVGIEGLKKHLEAQETSILTQDTQVRLKDGSWTTVKQILEGGKQVRCFNPFEPFYEGSAPCSYDPKRETFKDFRTEQVYKIESNTLSYTDKEVEELLKENASQGMQRVDIKVDKYLLDDINNPQDSELYKSLPRFTKEEENIILLDAGTGIGKTESMKALAESYLQDGAKHVFILFPKISIGKSKQDDTWKMHYNGEKGSYSNKNLATYDHILMLDDAMLNNSVFIIDEVHELAMSSFRPKLKDAFQRLFKKCPYILAMSGTVNPYIYKSSFKLHIKAHRSNATKMILHDVPCEKIKGKKRRPFTAQEFVTWRRQESEADYFLILVEDKKTLHALKQEDGIVYHSGESKRTIVSDGSYTIETGLFPKGKNVLLTTSGALAGWDLKVDGIVEVIIADTHPNIDYAEALAQYNARMRTQDTVHAYKMYNAGIDLSNNAPKFDYYRIQQKYEDRIQELMSMNEIERSYPSDAKSLLINDFKEASLIGWYEFVQREINLSYSNFYTTPKERREEYFKFIGFHDVIRHDPLVYVYDATPKNDDLFNKKIRKFINVVPTSFNEDDLSKFLSSEDDQEFRPHEKILNEVAQQAALEERPIKTTIEAIIKCFRLYDESSLRRYYDLKKDEALQPLTLVKKMNDYISASVPNTRARTLLIKKFKDKAATKEEIISYIMSIKDKWSDPKDFRKRVHKKARIENVLNGLVSYEDVKRKNTRHDNKYIIKDAAPLEVKPNQSMLRAEITNFDTTIDKKQLERIIKKLSLIDDAVSYNYDFKPKFMISDTAKRKAIVDFIIQRVRIEKEFRSKFADSQIIDIEITSERANITYDDFEIWSKEIS